MSRSGYTDRATEQENAMWRGAVASALRGKRGQQALREIAAALDAMPDKALAAESLVTADGEFCALGVLGAARGLDMSGIDTEDRGAVALAFGIAQSMAAEIMHENDTGVAEFGFVDVTICGPMRPRYPDWGRHQRNVHVEIPHAAERRWGYMRAWVERNFTAAKVQP